MGGRLGEPSSWLARSGIPLGLEMVDQVHIPRSGQMAARIVRAARQRLESPAVRRALLLIDWGTRNANLFESVGCP